MAVSDRYKLLLQQQYDACDVELVRERAKARIAIAEMNAYAGSYLQTENEELYAKYMQVRKQALPYVDDSCIIEQGFHADYGHNIHGAANSLISFNTTILDTVNVTIGCNCYIGPSVVITDVSHPIDAEPTERGRQAISKPVIIGNNVWICSNVTIAQGVTIGDNVIIAANTCVRHDIPSNSMVAGPEDKVIRTLTSSVSTE